MKDARQKIGWLFPNWEQKTPLVSDNLHHFPADNPLVILLFAT